MTTITYTCVLKDGDGVGQLPVPVDPKTTFGKARAPVVVTVNGHAYRSTVMTMNGVTFVPLRRSHREAAGVAPGDRIAMTLTLDTAPREVELPADLAAAIDAADLRAAWDRLAFTHQREHVEAIEGAKKPETRAKRIDAAVAKLR